MGVVAEKNTVSNDAKLKSSSFSKKEPSKSFFFQPKLTLGPTDDVYEREADAVADKVMRMTDNEQIQTKISPIEIQRKCEACEEEEKHMQRKTDNAAQQQSEAPPIVADALASDGKSLDDHTQTFMETRLGYDFSRVKIHTNSVSTKSAQAVNALAYTSGSNIVFNEGQYSPNTDNGKKLLAHELTHVVQQGGGSSKIQRQPGKGSAQPQPQPAPVPACPTFPSSGVLVIGSFANRLASILSFCLGSEVTINASQRLQLTNRPIPSTSMGAASGTSVVNVVNNTVGIIVDTDPNSPGTVVGAFDHACPGRQFVNVRNIDVMARASGAGGGLDDCSAVLHEMEEAVLSRQLSAQGTTGNTLFQQSHARGTTVEDSIRTGSGLSVRNQGAGNTVVIGNLSGGQLLVLGSTVFGTGAQTRTQLNVMVCTPVSTGPSQSTCVNEVRASHVANGAVSFTTRPQAITVFNRFASDFGFQPITP